MATQLQANELTPAALFEKNKKQFEPVLTQHLAPIAYNLINAAGSEHKDKFMHIAAEIAKSSADQTFTVLGRIQDTSQITQVLADSLAQAIANHPELSSNPKIKVDQIYEKARSQVAKIVSDDYKSLERVAVLGNLTQIENLARPNEDLRKTIIGETNDFIDSNHPLVSTLDREKEYGKVAGFLQNYADEVKDSVASKVTEENIPTLVELQKAKDAIVEKVAANLDTNNPNGIDSKGLVEHIGYLTGAKPLNTAATQTLGLGNAQPSTTTFTYKTGFDFGIGLSISASRDVQNQTNDVLLAHDAQRLEINLKEQAETIDSFKGKPSLGFGEQRALSAAQKRYQRLLEIRANPEKKQQMRAKILTYFQKRTGPLRLDNASRLAWQTYNIHNNRYPGIWVPESPSYQESYQPQRLVSALSASTGSYTQIGNPIIMVNEYFSDTRTVFSGIKTGAQNIPRVVRYTGTTIEYTGKSIQLAGTGLQATGKAISALKAIPYVGVVFAGIGAGVQATGTGLKGIGRGIESAGKGMKSFGKLGKTSSLPGNLKQMTSLSRMATASNPVGIAMLAMKSKTLRKAVMAAGGLAAYLLIMFGIKIVGAISGLAIGLVTGLPLLAIPGAGPFLYAGYVGAWTYYGWTHPIQTIYLITHPLAPVYAVGHFFGGALGGIGNGISAAGSFFAGAASSIWGGISSFAGSLASGASSVFGSIWGGITSISFSGSAIAAPVITGIGTIAISSIIGGHITSASFFNNQADQTEGSGPPPIANQYVDISKLVSSTSPAQGPATAVTIGNNNLPQTLKYDIKVTAKNKVSGLTCTDKLTLLKKDGTTEDISALLPNVPPVPYVCNNLNIGEDLSFSFNVNIPNDPKFNDSVVINKFSLAGSGEGSTIDTDYYIPIRDLNVNQLALDGVRARALDGRYPDNLITATCPGGQTCWDYVIATSRAANVSPTFILAVWYEESHFSDVGNHFSCPVSVARTHDGTGLSGSLDCFINQIVVNAPNTSDGFLDVMNHFCGTGTYGSGEPTCSNNPNFLANLKSAYIDLGGVALPLAGGTTGAGIPFTADAAAFATIGSPPNNCPHGWPATGYISQGPEGPYSHADHPAGPYTGGFEAIDIAKPLYGSIFATLDGEVVQSSGDGLNQTIAVQPTNCPGLDVVYFLHLASRAVATGDHVTWGEEIAQSGQAGTGAHTHYQFNEPFNRIFQISDPPHIPTQITRDCIEITNPCGVDINNAP